MKKVEDKKEKKDESPIKHHKSTMLVTSLTGLRFSIFTMLHKNSTAKDNQTSPAIFCFNSDGDTKRLFYTDYTVMHFPVSNRYILRCGKDVGESIVGIVEEGSKNTIYRLDFNTFIEDLIDEVKNSMTAYVSNITTDRPLKKDRRVYFEDFAKTKRTDPVYLTVSEVMGPMALLINTNSGKPFCKICTRV